MLIYSMGVSVDGFIADREGAFGWSAPSEEQFGFHLAQVGELGGYLCGRRLYETMLVWETDRSLRDTELGAAFADVWGAIPKVVFSHTLDSVQGTVGIRPHLDRDPWKSGPMAVIERLDFLGVPTQDPERSRAFYRDVLGLRPDEHADWEQWAGDTCFAIWEPEKQGMPFVAQKGNPWPLRCDDVAKMRAALEAKGVQFSGDTFDTGVCHMAIFADPDGNELMLHRRYAPYE